MVCGIGHRMYRLVLLFREKEMKEVDKMVHLEWFTVEGSFMMKEFEVHRNDYIVMFESKWRKIWYNMADLRFYTLFHRNWACTKPINLFYYP